MAMVNQLNNGMQIKLVYSVQQFALATAESYKQIQAFQNDPQVKAYAKAHQKLFWQTQDTDIALDHRYNIATDGLNTSKAGPIPPELAQLKATQQLLDSARNEYNERHHLTQVMNEAGVPYNANHVQNVIQDEIRDNYSEPVDLNLVKTDGVGGSLANMVQNTIKLPTIKNGKIIANPADKPFDINEPVVTQTHTALALNPPKPAHTASPVPVKPAPEPIQAHQGKQTLAPGERAQIAADKLNINDSIAYLDAHHVKHPHLHKLLPPTGNDHDGAQKHAMHVMKSEVTHGAALWRWMHHHHLEVHTAAEFIETPRTPAQPSTPAPKHKS